VALMHLMDDFGNLKDDARCLFRWFVQYGGSYHVKTESRTFNLISDQRSAIGTKTVTTESPPLESNWHP
jgi:hypothetical protein